MPSQKRKSSAGSSERLSPWQNYEEAKKVEANLLQTLALLKGDGLSHDDKKMRQGPCKCIVCTLSRRPMIADRCSLPQDSSY